MKAYYRSEDEFVKIVLDDDVCIVGMEGNGNLFELQWNKNTRKLILWTDADLILKCKSGNTVILMEGEIYVNK